VKVYPQLSSRGEKHGGSMNDSTLLGLDPDSAPRSHAQAMSKGFDFEALAGHLANNESRADHQIGAIRCAMNLRPTKSVEVASH
jgi:hypothetical protein